MPVMSIPYSSGGLILKKLDLQDTIVSGKALQIPKVDLLY